MKYAAIFLIALIVLFAGYKIIQYGISQWSCASSWRDSGIEYRYKLRGGCQLKTGKGWIPARNYRFE